MINFADKPRVAVSYVWFRLGALQQFSGLARASAPNKPVVEWLQE